MFDIITFGSATRDIIIRPKNLTGLQYKKSETTAEVCFPFGSKIDIEEIYFSSGGGGTNTAATFTKQGFKTAFCGSLGNDLSGQEIIGELKNLKIETKFVFKKNEKSTNHSIVILNDAQDRTILVYRGAAELLNKKDIPWQKLKTKWIYLAPMSGLLCLPTGSQVTTLFSDIVDFAYTKKINLAVNPGMAQLSLESFPEIAKKIDVLFLNQEEASFLTKIPFQNEKEIFKKIDEMCPGITVMTKGGGGVVVSEGKYIYSAKPNSDRKIVDTTGAGDSFASGFLAEYIRENGDIEKAIQFGMANSEGCISQIGAKNGLLEKGQKFQRVNVTKKQII